MRLSQKIKLLVLATCCCIAPTSFAAAADTNTGSAANKNDATKIDLYLYFWPAGINGDVRAYHRHAHVNIPFDDILRDLKMGATGAIKISKNNWFVFNDLLYLDVAPSVAETVHKINVAAKLDTRVVVDMLAVGRQWQTRIPWNLFAGVHYFHGRIDLAATESLGPYHDKQHVLQTKDWFTPTIGGEINLPINNKLSFDCIADIGAANRSVNWEVVPTFLWKFNDTAAATIGYRLLDIRHRENNFKLDTLMHGPIIGVKITF